MTVHVGDTAPDFTVRNQNHEDVTLSSFRGRKLVLLVFYPFAFSRLCTSELCMVRDDLPSFQNEAVQMLAVSTDPTYTLKAWAGAEGYTFPLLSDFWPHGEVAKLYGVFNDTRGMAVRGTFLIDREGIVRFAEINGSGEARDQGAWKAALAEISD
ncbi:MAG: peroxiredoxin [Geodermatophilaceae bacterium]|nr:peroxiredoxin [Geodermatophilaceae bacterium]MDQ3466503.1 peroxiredoxin [Actinomycetota bacterium]